MRKSDKKRLKRVRHHELVCAARDRVRRAYAKHDQFQFNPTVETVVLVVQSLGTKYLSVIANHPTNFTQFLLGADLVRLANDEVALRAMKIEHT